MIVALRRNNELHTIGIHHWSQNDDCTIIECHSLRLSKIMHGYKKDGCFWPHNSIGPASIVAIPNKVEYEFFLHGTCVNLGENCESDEDRLFVELKYGHLKYFTNGDNTRTYYE